MAVERELKFSLVDPAVPALEELRAALEPAGFDAASAASEELVDRYFDDDGGSLRGAGWALRRRSGGAQSWATLKGAGATDGALHRREELEVPIAGDGSDAPWPDEILERLAGIVDPAELRPRLELRSTRERFRILKDGRDAATLSFDGVEACVPGSERSALFDELEIEAAAETSDADLRIVGDAIDGLVRLTPSTVTKLERAEALLMLATW